MTGLFVKGSLVLHQLFIAHHLERRLLPPWVLALAVATIVAAASGGSASARVTAAAAPPCDEAFSGG